MGNAHILLISGLQYLQNWTIFCVPHLPESPHCSRAHAWLTTHFWLSPFPPSLPSFAPSFRREQADLLGSQEEKMGTEGDTALMEKIRLAPYCNLLKWHLVKSSIVTIFITGSMSETSLGNASLRKSHIHANPMGTGHFSKVQSVQVKQKNLPKNILVHTY